MLVTQQSEKQMLRDRFRRARALLKPEEKLFRDTEILSRLLAMPAYADCRTVFTYVSKPLEINTEPLLWAAWANGKQVAVPRCSDADGQMHFYVIERMEQLVPGAFGVQEPEPDAPQACETQPDALCVVPGFCFDSEGYRLGYGKGCYDRFLPRFAGVTVGLCGAADLMLRLPRETTDCPVEYVVTEQFLRRATRQEERKDLDHG